MDVREKLVELIYQTMSCTLNPDKQLIVAKSEFLADYLIANGVTVQEWIPVTERLPEIASKHGRRGYTFTNSVRVLCVCVQKDGKTMVKEGFCQLWGDDTEPFPVWKIPGSIDSVTHWMPLPQPPKGE